MLIGLSRATLCRRRIEDVKFVNASYPDELQFECGVEYAVESLIVTRFTAAEGAGVLDKAPEWT